MHRFDPLEDGVESSVPRELLRQGTEKGHRGLQKGDYLCDSKCWLRALAECLLPCLAQLPEAAPGER